MTQPWRPRSVARFATLTMVLASAAACADPAENAGLGPDPFWIDGGDADADDGASASDGNGDGSDGTDAGGADDSASASDGAANDGAPDGASPVEQHFAALLTSREQTQDPSPFGSGWAEQTTTTLALVRVVWQGDVGTRWVQTCGLHTTAAHGAQVSYPDAFLAAVPVEPAALTRQGALWTQAETVEVIGLPSGYEGAMPKTGDAKHPALIDADGDGNPGVSLGVSVNLLGSHKLYVAQRARIAWQGEVDGEGVVRAEPTIVEERSVVGASLSLLVADTARKPVVGKPPHTLRWQPLPGAIGCQALVANAAALVGATWPP